MVGAELAMARKRALEDWKMNYFGSGREAGYWDVDELSRLVHGGATYSAHRQDANTLIAWALLRLGADRAQVLTAYDVKAADMDALTLGTFVLSDERRAAVLAQIEKDWPESSGLGQSVADAGAGGPTMTPSGPHSRAV